MRRLNELNILVAMVPKTMTHLLLPLDVTTNGKIKKMERTAFSDYFTTVIMSELLENPEKDVSTISVDLKLSTLKPKHLSTLIKIYEFFQSEEGQKIILSGFRFTGISGTVNNPRNGIVLSLDPYV